MLVAKSKNLQMGRKEFVKSGYFMASNGSHEDVNFGGNRTEFTD
jgi:hypothetical protein